MNGKGKAGLLFILANGEQKAFEPHWITAQQIESCRIAITRTLKRNGNL